MKKVLLSIMLGVLVMFTITPTLALTDAKTVRELSMEVRGNRLVNQDLVNEVRQLRLSIRNRIKSIKDNGIELDEATIETIKSTTSELKEYQASLKETQGVIRSITENSKEWIKDRNWEQLHSMYEEIKVVQETRNNDLQQIVRLMQELDQFLAGIQ
jgi:predicted house-cleaning noncanonical NTP pyrophosphatase (MazG superfamily)